MNSFDFDNVKAEKANAMKKYHRLRKIANLFRLLEICLALIFLSWFSTRLPSVVQISGYYFKNLCVVLVSPRFVFLIGNVIVLTLFAKSGQFSGKNSTGNNEGTNLYDEFVKSSENRQKIHTDCNSSHQTEEIVFEDKQTVCEEISLSVTRTPRDTEREKDSNVLKKKCFRRSRSENVKPEIISEKLHQRELRRSETEKCREVKKSGDESARNTVSDEKEMSNEEFQRTIEAFIAKQVKFRWQESMAIVVQNQS